MTSIARLESAATPPDAIVAAALAALHAEGDDARALLDDLPTPLYTTDAAGRLTWFNPACVAFAGRTPNLATDRWCVSWKLFTEAGDYLPHEECPMAVAVREQRPVRDVEAVAERPDGSRVAFRPYPTPLFDADGAFVGALNMLVDISTEKQAAYLRTQSARCRRFARSVSDAGTAETLRGMADDFERQADELGRLN